MIYSTWNVNPELLSGPRASRAAFSTHSDTIDRPRAIAASGTLRVSLKGNRAVSRVAALSLSLLTQHGEEAADVIERMISKRPKCDWTAASWPYN